jgi:hypothetical protein
MSKFAPTGVPTAPLGYDPLSTQRALSILRGSNAGFVQAWVAFAVSIGLCAFGTVTCEMDTAERRFFGLAALYMTASGFTLAKTYRDRLLAGLLEDVAHTAAVCSALRGTEAWGIQVVASFLSAVGFSFYTLLTSVGDGDWTGDPGFAVCACVFAVVSTMNLAKAVRDRADAVTLNTVVFADEQTKCEKILLVSRGSLANYVLCVFAFVTASFTTIGGIFWMDDEVLNMDRKGFIFMGMILAITSAFNTAKLVRDLADPVLAENANCPFVIMTACSFLGALTIGIGGVFYMPIPDPKKRFITNGLCFCVASSFALAKMVRDRNEVQKLTGHVPTGAHDFLKGLGIV